MAFSDAQLRTNEPVCIPLEDRGQNVGRAD